MKALQLEQMVQVEGGKVEPPFCGSSIGARILQIHPVVGGFCIGVAIGNWLYS